MAAGSDFVVDYLQAQPETLANAWLQDWWWQPVASKVDLVALLHDFFAEAETLSATCFVGEENVWYFFLYAFGMDLMRTGEIL